MVAENPGSGGASPPEAAPLPGGFWRGSLPWVALLAWLLLAALTVLALWYMRSSTLRDQQRALHTLTVALAEGIERGLEGVEEGLTAVGGALEDNALPARSEGDSIELRKHVELMPMAQTLWLLDAQGRGRLRSDAIGFPEAGTFLPPLKAPGNEGLAISVPLHDPEAAMPLIAVALPVDKPRAGWVVAGIPVNALLGAFEVALPEDGANMMVLRQDGAILASTVDERQMPSLRQGMLVERIKVQSYGLEVQVLRNRTMVLQDWRHSAQIAGALLGLLGLVMGVAVLAVRRAQYRHAQAEQALLAQQSRAVRLEALGKLAGEVAHDFNNVLGAIVGYGEMAQEKAVPGSAQARQLERLMGAAGRGRALTERILAFSRGGARRSVVFALQPVVEEVLEHIRSLPHAGITVEEVLLAQGLSLRGDPLQAYQAVMNLCVNAVQAMPQGGALRVVLGRERVDAPQVLSHSQLAEGEWLKLTVSDEGNGIDPVSMEHLLEPFYTTRAGEGGSGLGLAVVHGAVVELGGAIDVHGSPGQGATFTLWFPLCSAQGQGSRVSAGWADGLPVGQGEWVLVLDDEPELAQLVAQHLQALGYQPRLESDGRRALERLRTEPAAFAALLTDERMPEMSGTELVQQLHQEEGLLKHLPVALLTGHGGPGLAQRAMQLGVAHVLIKPVKRSELALALAAMLKQRRL